MPTPKAYIAMFYKVNFDSQSKAHIAVSYMLVLDAHSQSIHSSVLQGCFRHSAQKPAEHCSTRWVYTRSPKPASHSFARCF